MADTELKIIVDEMCEAIDKIGGLTGLTEDLGTIDENNLYSEAFERQVPVSLKILVAADNVLHEEGGEVSGSLELIESYRALGIGLINADEKVDPNEERDMDIYLKMMTDYRNANYRGK